MSSLLNLPGDVIIEILASWLKSNEVAKLDSAVCNQKKRSDFLQILKCPEFMIPSFRVQGYHSTNVCHSYMRWIEHREIKLKSLSLKGIDFENHVVKWKIDLSYVSLLHLHETGGIIMKGNEHTDVELDFLTFLSAKNLPKLVALHFESVTYNQHRTVALMINSVDRQLLKQLQDIHVCQFGKHVFSPSLKSIAESCFSLRKFCVKIRHKCEYNSALEQDLVSVLKNNCAHLESFSTEGISIADELGDALLQFGTNLQIIYIWLDSNFSSKYLAEIINRCPKLQTLDTRNAFKRQFYYDAKVQSIDFSSFDNHELLLFFEYLTIPQHKLKLIHNDQPLPMSLIRAISNDHLELNTLNFTYCSHINIVEIMKYLTKVHTIVLSIRFGGIVTFSAQDLITVCESHNSLTTVDLDIHGDITTEEIKTLLNLRKLKFIGLSRFNKGPVNRKEIEAYIAENGIDAEFGDGLNRKDICS